MCSLLQLIPPEASLELRMEQVAAMIMIKLEPLLDQWTKDGGSFESLTDLYLRRWLHSCVYPNQDRSGFLLIRPQERDRRGDDRHPAATG